MSAKMATLSLLKITVFWKKGYGVIIFVHDVTNQILLQGFDQKNHFFEGCSWIKFNNLELALGMALTLHQCDKKVKTKSQKVLRANSYICISYRVKIGWGCLFAPPPPLPIFNRVKIKQNPKFSSFRLEFAL